jgi:anaerobic magnesium-protoporphyrin IX monomethyl ester cyclase
MFSPPVAIIAFEEFDNLGVGYIASVLDEAGYESEVVDFRQGKAKILGIINKLKPKIVGFSLIFEYHINEFSELILYLREGGIRCHFCAGGEYASLRCAELFEMIPSLDSIVRFEGEYTFRELVNCIYSGRDWTSVLNLAYKKDNKIIINDLRPPEADLDVFPFPMRSPLREYALDKKFATILAGRGCINNCSFCSVREYYKQSSGPFKRIRKPEKVVEEMELLYLQKDCSIFLFQDDDFPVKTQKVNNWVKRFCRELKRKELSDDILWKINCRPDEVDFNTFSLLKNHGLFLVFLGIEDGTDEGLSLMNKHITTSKILEGINILKDLGIGFDYGYMPFHPYSTFDTVRENFKFLRKICSDGYTGVIILKMMPFCGTNIEKNLRCEGRITGEPGFLDYDFLDDSLNKFYKFISGCFDDWLMSRDGLLNITKWARNYLSVFSRYYEYSEDLKLLNYRLTCIMAESNIFLLNILEDLANIFETGNYDSIEVNDLNNYRRKIKSKHSEYNKRVKNIISNLLVIRELHRQFQ